MNQQLEDINGFLKHVQEYQLNKKPVKKTHRTPNKIYYWKKKVKKKDLIITDLQNEITSLKRHHQMIIAEIKPYYKQLGYRFRKKLERLL